MFPLFGIGVWGLRGEGGAKGDREEGTGEGRGGKTERAGKQGKFGEGERERGNNGRGKGKGRAARERERLGDKTGGKAGNQKKNLKQFLQQLQVRLGFPNRLKMAEAVKERERAEFLRQQRAAVALKLAPLRKAFKPDVIQRLRPWKDQYTKVVDRYHFLVLRGASRTGKSTLARGLGVALGLGGEPFIQTVQSAESPDLRNYRPEVHKYIVFDNVNNMKFILDYRALLQANNDVHTLGDSRTGCYAYDVWIHQVPIVVTVDLSACWDPHESWIKDNCFDVYLDGPSWLDGA